MVTDRQRKERATSSAVDNGDVVDEAVDLLAVVVVLHEVAPARWKSITCSISESTCSCIRHLMLLSDLENLLSIGRICYQLGRILPQFCFCYMNWRICDQSGICDQFLHCYQYWRILYQISELNFTPREAGDPMSILPSGGGSPVNFKKIRKNTLKIRTICLNASSNHLHYRIHSHTGCIRGCIVTL